MAEVGQIIRYTADCVAPAFQVNKEIGKDLILPIFKKATEANIGLDQIQIVVLKTAEKIVPYVPIVHQAIQTTTRIGRPSPSLTTWVLWASLAYLIFNERIQSIKSLANKLKKITSSAPKSTPLMRNVTAIAGTSFREPSLSPLWIPKNETLFNVSASASNPNQWPKRFPKITPASLKIKTEGSSSNPNLSHLLHSGLKFKSTSKKRIFPDAEEGEKTDEDNNDRPKNITVELISLFVLALLGIISVDHRKITERYNIKLNDLDEDRYEFIAEDDKTGQTKIILEKIKPLSAP